MMSNSGQKMKTCPTSRITFHTHHIASIGRAAFEAIADLPLYDDHQRPPGAIPLTFRKAFEPKGRPADRGQRVRFAAGLVIRVVKALTALGFKIRVDDQPVEILTEDQLGQQVPGRVRRACARPRSLIVERKLAAKIGFIAELHSLMPESHLLVVAKNNQQAREAAGSLAKATSREATWGWEQRRAYPWLHVKSVGALAHDSAWQWDVVIFLDAKLAMTTTAMGFLTPGIQSIRIGFVAYDVHRLHERERAILEGMFGPVDHDNRFAGDLVAWLRPKRSAPKPFNNIVERLRQQVRKNDTRNRLIARAARALTALNTVALDRLGLTEATTALLGDDPPSAPTVAIIAANAEQAQELARLLPTWRLEMAGYSPPPGTLIRDDRVIMTLARAAEDLLATTVIIFAAGGRDWLEHAHIAFTWESEGLLILDVADHDDAASLADVRSRAAGYRHGGYREVPANNPNPNLGMANVTMPISPKLASEAIPIRPTQKGGAELTLRS